MRVDSVRGALSERELQVGAGRLAAQDFWRGPGGRKRDECFALSAEERMVIWSSEKESMVDA